MEDEANIVPLDPCDVRAVTILDEIYRADFRDRRDRSEASFLVCDRLEELLYEESYNLCDRILKRVDVTKISTTVMRSLLTVTWDRREEFKERAGLLVRVEREMQDRLRLELTERLLRKMS